ncbi:MAG: uroporphyrinogen decarboxylase family protein, partial [Candidatus Zipacnadales bacterium]
YYGVDISIVVGEEGLAPSCAKVLEQTDTYTLRRDSWGRVIRTVPGGFFYEQVENAVQKPTDLERLAVDPPSAKHRYASVDAHIDTLKRRFCVFAKVGGPFIRTAFVRGELEFLCDMAADPLFARELASFVGRHLIEIGLEQLRRWDLYDTGIWIADDMASNLGPLFSPRTADQILVPIWAEMVSRFKAVGARKVILHSDGNIGPLLDRFIEIGFDGINPVEPKAELDPVALRKRYGDRLALLGGLDNAHILPQGDPAEVRRHVETLVALGREGGLVAGMHSVGPDISVQTYDDVIRILRGGIYES